MRTYAELEALWQSTPAAPRTRGRVRLLCVRSAPGVHACPARVTLDEARGILGDRWWDKPDRDVAQQVTLMSHRAAELVCADHAPLDAPGDNLLVDLDLAEATLPAGTRLRIGGAVLEVSVKPHTGCKKFSERFGMDALRWVNDHRGRRLRGVNCRIVAGGEVAIGDVVEVVEALQ